MNVPIYKYIRILYICIYVYMYTYTIDTLHTVYVIYHECNIINAFTIDKNK